MKHCRSPLTPLTRGALWSIWPLIPVISSPSAGGALCRLIKLWKLSCSSQRQNLTAPISIIRSFPARRPVVSTSIATKFCPAAQSCCNSLSSLLMRILEEADEECEGNEGYEDQGAKVHHRRSGLVDRVILVPSPVAKQ